MTLLQDRVSPGTIVNIISTSEHAGQPYLAPAAASNLSGPAAGDVQ